MLFLKRTEFKKIENLLKIPAQKPLVIFLILFSLAVILGSLIYYQKISLARKKMTETRLKPTEIDEKTYEEILKIWQEKEKKFQEADFRKYPDPFNLRGEQF